MRCSVRLRVYGIGGSGDGALPSRSLSVQGPQGATS